MTLWRVVRSEGLRSAAVRALERMSESSIASGADARVVNVAGTRHGGVAVQWKWRLAEERRLRDVAVNVFDGRPLIVDGAFDGVPVQADVYVIHDFSLVSANPQELEVDAARLANASEVFARARAVVFASAFLRDAYRTVLPHIDARVIEPGIVGGNVRAEPIRNRIAFAGDVRPHKGSALLPEIIRATPGAEWHIFGGGDLRALRALRNVHVHGYYRAGSLPRMLARHRIALAVLPSRFLETFSLALSECWSAGVPVVSFDRGAIAERIRAHGGGFLAPYDFGAEGIAQQVRGWLRGARVEVPAHVPTARDAALAHVALYRELELI